MHLPPADTAVIVHDPSDTYPEGEVIHHAEIDRLRAENAVALDSGRSELRTPGMGFARRAFGYGQELDSYRLGPSFLCPTLLRIGPGQNALHWAALVRRYRTETPNGQLRLGVMPFESSLPPSVASVSHVQLDQLDPESDAWIVQGRAVVDADVAMSLPFALAGVGKGVLVRWLAIGHRILG